MRVGFAGQFFEDRDFAEKLDFEAIRVVLLVRLHLLLLHCYVSTSTVRNEKIILVGLSVKAQVDNTVHALI